MAVAQTTPEAQPHFSQPFRQIALMLIVLGLSGFGAVVALPRVLPVFQANPYLNGFIHVQSNVFITRNHARRI